MNKILEVIFPNLKIRTGNIYNFPSGNMFWIRTAAIYLIFNEIIIKSTPEEKGQTDCTIMHGIERIWLYIVKLNGFDYKTILYFIY